MAAEVLGGRGVMASKGYDGRGYVRGNDGLWRAKFMVVGVMVGKGYGR